jgi:hypothetical protein
MDVKRKLPHEGVKNSDDGLDGVKANVEGGEDTEGHRVPPGVDPDGVSWRAVPDELTVNPGTGGDFAPRRPSTGGEFIDENDVEGHRAAPSSDELTVNPGTGGDFAPRRPSTGGEFIDENDVEGHAR